MLKEISWVTGSYIRKLQWRGRAAFSLEDAEVRQWKSMVSLKRRLVCRRDSARDPEEAQEFATLANEADAIYPNLLERDLETAEIATKGAL